MFTRTITALVAVLMLPTGNVFPQQPTVFQPSTWKQADSIVLEMTGELAREYAQISGSIEGNKNLGGFSISTTAVISQRLENEQVRIEHMAQVTKDGQPDRLVTLTATVDKTAMRSFVRTVFMGEFRFSDSPDSKELAESPTVSATHLSTTHLSLTELKGVKIRSWTLESEIGE
jgi:hypothetical protein